MKKRLGMLQSRVQASLSSSPRIQAQSYDSSIFGYLFSFPCASCRQGHRRLNAWTHQYSSTTGSHTCAPCAMQIMGKAILKSGDFEAAYPKVALAYQLTHSLLAASQVLECSIGRWHRKIDNTHHTSIELSEKSEH